VGETTWTAICVSNALQREGITSLLQSTSYKVVATVGRPSELPDQNFAKADRALAIIVIDSKNGNLNQIAQSISRLKSLTPNCKVVLIAEANGLFDVPSVLALAPDGYILNLGSRDVLLKSLGMICSSNQKVFVFGILPNEHLDRLDFTSDGPAAGYQCCSPSEIKRVGLSARECQVLSCLARGESNKQIARLYDLSAATVKVHLRAVLRKTNAKNRTQAAIWAIERGLLTFNLEENAVTRTHYPERMPDLLRPSVYEPKARIASQSFSQEFAAAMKEQSLPDDADA
jgi:two-component system, NarL family, nitrate/nitrite response regulator NarL